MNDLALAEMIEGTEAAACSEMMQAAPREWGFLAERTPAGVLLLASTVDKLIFNRVIGCGIEAPADREQVQNLLARYRAAGIGNYGVQLSPAARPPELPAWLEAEGLAPRNNWAKTYRKAGEVPEVPTDLRIEPAGPEHADAVGKITCTAFGMEDRLWPWFAGLVGQPNWYHYLGWDGDEAVATGALFVHGKVGWLGIGGTLAAARRRGGQGAILARRLLDGMRLGCEWFLTETGEDLPERPNPSFHNMMRTGFRVAYQRANYQVPVD